MRYELDPKAFRRILRRVDEERFQIEKAFVVLFFHHTVSAGTTGNLLSHVICPILVNPFSCMFCVLSMLVVVAVVIGAVVLMGKNVNI